MELMWSRDDASRIILFYNEIVLPGCSYSVYPKYILVISLHSTVGSNWLAVDTRMLPDTGFEQMHLTLNSLKRWNICV